MPKKSSSKKKSSGKTIASSKKNLKAEQQKRKVKLLKVIVEDLINKPSAEIVDLLAGKSNVNEFSIAKNLNLTINQTRNILYKLSDFGLVRFVRKKDKRKGWYIYFWTLNTHQALSLLNENLEKKLEVLKNQLGKRKNGRHYVCEICSIEVTEEIALLNDFVCPECEEVYQLFDDSEIVGEIEKKIGKIEREIEAVNREMEVEEEKLGKEKARKIEKAEKEKKEKRRKAAAERKAKKLLEEKRSGKTKKAKEKVVKKKLKTKNPKKKKLTKRASITKKSSTKKTSSSKKIKKK